MDFGTSRYVTDEKGAVESDKHHSIRWVSPELIMEGRKTLASDVYAFAMTIFEVELFIQSHLPNV